MPTFHQILSRMSSLRRRKSHYQHQHQHQHQHQQELPYEGSSPRELKQENPSPPGVADEGLSSSMTAPAASHAPRPTPVPGLSMSGHSTPTTAVEPSSATTPPASPLNQERSIDVDHLEFAASRDLALLLGTSWDSQKKPLADLSLLPQAALPPTPQENNSSGHDKDRAFRTLPKKHRLSLYRAKSLTALRRSKSIPNVTQPPSPPQEGEDP